MRQSKVTSATRAVRRFKDLRHAHAQRLRRKGRSSKGEEQVAAREVGRKPQADDVTELGRTYHVEEGQLVSGADVMGDPSDEGKEASLETSRTVSQNGGGRRSFLSLPSVQGRLLLRVVGGLGSPQLKRRQRNEDKSSQGRHRAMKAS